MEQLQELTQLHRRKYNKICCIQNLCRCCYCNRPTTHQAIRAASRYAPRFENCTLQFLSVQY